MNSRLIHNVCEKNVFTFSDERFDYAQNCKEAVELLQRAGLRLGKYEIEKRMAIEEENYDRAKQKKDHIDEYKLAVMRALKVEQLIEDDGVSVHCDNLGDLYGTLLLLPHCRT